MSFFDKLKANNDQKSKDEILDDRIGGFRTLESGIYTGKINIACLGQSDSGAAKVHLDLTFEDGTNYSEDIWISNSKGELYYTDDSGTKKNMKGYNIVNAICMLLTGTALKNDEEEQEVEERTFSLWSKAEGKKTDQSVPTLINLIGQNITLGIMKTRLNKNEKGDDGKYHPTNEERFENSIEAVFHPELKVTLSEALKANEKGTEPVAEFIEKWKEANEGRLADKFKEVKGGGKPGGMKKPVAGGGDAPKKKMGLFNKD